MVSHTFETFVDFKKKIMSITHDLLSWEYALTGYEKKIISYLTLNSDVTPRTCPNVLHGFILKGDMVSHTYLS